MNKDCLIFERVSNIRRFVEFNIYNNERMPLPASDILLIKALTGGRLRIDNRRTDSPDLCEKLRELEAGLATAENVILSKSRDINGVNLIIGDLVSVALKSALFGPVYTSLLRNISMLIIPDKEVYRNMQQTELKKGSVCQKLLSLNTEDIVEAVFKINTLKLSFNKEVKRTATTVCSTDDLADLTGDDDFILLLHDDLAFMVATIEDENGEAEQQFYIINGKKEAFQSVQKLDDYSILSLYIAAPELKDE